MNLDAIVGDLAAGRTAALARAISLVENGRDGFEHLLAAIHPRLGRAHRIGVTGPPGAGKSTLTQHLVQAYRARGLTVAVVAVDPTSPFSGGALLGDRIRMEAVALDQGVYIRSMATRGSLGGLATSTREVGDVLDAGGFDRILIETAGVGQSELDIASMADSTLLVLVPESGDGIQALKSGVMEIGDIYVVNKADRPGAEHLAREIEVTLGFRQGNAFRGMRAHHGVAHGGRDAPAHGRRDARAQRDHPSGRPSGGGGDGERDAAASWDPPVLLTAATRGEGIDRVTEALDRHHSWMVEHGELDRRRRRRLAVRTREVVERAMRRWIWRETRAEELIAERLDAVAAGQLSPYELAQEIVMGLKEGARV